MKGTSRRLAAPRILARAGLCLSLGVSLTTSGCMSLTPQLEPTDVSALEQVKDRGERERLYRQNAIKVHHEPLGRRYTKGDHPRSEKRSWQSLDKILRSDRNSAMALPDKKLARSRALAAGAGISSMLIVAGGAATARDGFNFQDVNAGNAILIAGALLTIGFAVAAGITYSRARKDYERAVDIYNDSLGLRLGVFNAAGQWRRPDNIVVDEQGFVIVENPEGPRAPMVTPTQPGAQPQLPAQPAPISQPQPAARQPAVTPQPQPTQPVPATQPAPATQPGPATQPAQPAVPPPERAQPVVPAPPRSAAVIEPGRPLALLPRD